MPDSCPGITAWAGRRGIYPVLLDGTCSLGVSLLEMELGLLWGKMWGIKEGLSDNAPGPGVT